MLNWGSRTRRAKLSSERKLPCKPLPFQPLKDPRLVLLIETELGIQPYQRVLVHRCLFGQLAEVSLLELTQPLFLLIQLSLHPLKLDSKELSCSDRLSFTQLEVLLDKQGSEGVGHFRHGFRIPTAE